tara:strand:- start:189 stop:359 length:171 start_codon:yes stop_codon:yes gene_type:complete
LYSILKLREHDFDGNHIAGIFSLGPLWMAVREEGLVSARAEGGGKPYKGGEIGSGE